MSSTTESVEAAAGLLRTTSGGGEVARTASWGRSEVEEDMSAAGEVATSLPLVETVTSYSSMVTEAPPPAVSDELKDREAEVADEDEIGVAGLPSVVASTSWSSSVVTGSDADGESEGARRCVGLFHRALISSNFARISAS